MKILKIFICIVIVLSINIVGVISIHAAGVVLQYGEYEGTYDVPNYQGLTGVKITINSGVTAIVEIFTAPGGSAIPSISWNATYSYDSSTDYIKISAISWINTSTGWSMVDFGGTNISGNITGDVYDMGMNSSIGKIGIALTKPFATLKTKSIKTVKGAKKVKVKGWLKDTMKNINSPNVQLSYGPSITVAQKKLFMLPKISNKMDLEFEADKDAVGIFEFVAKATSDVDPLVSVSDTFTINISPSKKDLKIKKYEFDVEKSRILTNSDPVIMLEQFNQIIAKSPTDEILINSFEEIVDKIKTNNVEILLDTDAQNKIKAVAANIQEEIASVDLPTYLIEDSVISVMPEELDSEVIVSAKRAFDVNSQINKIIANAGFLFGIDVVVKINAQNVWDSNNSIVDTSSNFIKGIFNAGVKDINISSGISDIIINKTSIADKTGKVRFVVLRNDPKSYNLEVYNEEKRIEALNEQAVLKIPYLKASQENIDSYAVFRQDVDGNVNMNAMYDSFSSNFILRTNHFSMYIIMSNPSTFSDNLDNWNKSFINSLYSMGIVSGSKDNKFRAGDDITREEFVTMIINSLGILDKNAKSDFSDVSSDDWCYAQISTAYESSIMRGIGNGEFGVGKPIKREDAIVTIGNVFTRFSKINMYYNNDILNKFNDKDSIDNYAKKYFSLLLNMAIVKGDLADNLNPQSQLKRGEASVMIFKLLEYMNAQGIPINKKTEAIEVN